MIIGVLKSALTQNAYRDSDLEFFLCVSRLDVPTCQQLDPSHDRGCLLYTSDAADE